MEAKRKIRLRAQVDTNACVACGCCAKVCPMNTIEIYRGLYAQVGDKCIGCGKCAKECPASIIALREVSL